MALDRATKEKLLDDYNSGFAKSPNAFVVGYRGMSVPQVDDLRKKVRATGGRYQVVKNTLALIAVKDTPLQPLSEHFAGPTAIAYSGKDAVALAKVLTDFTKGAELLEFRGGLVDGQTIKGADVKAIADLPSREVLIGKLLFLLQTPITRLVRDLGAITQQFVSVIDQVRQQKESQSGAQESSDAAAGG
jgi:large subunit ribosomal protein L10